MNVLSLTRFIVNHPLNRTGKAAALGRFARWQIASRLIARPVALPFAGGTSLLTRRGMTGATGNYYCGLHEPAEMGFVLHALRADDLFADIGANVGSYTVLAAGAVGAQVIAVEPLPATYDLLMANVRLNDLAARVAAHCCGLSSEPGEIRFTSELDTMNRVATAGETLPTVTVPVMRLDDLCAARIPRLLKIDVEGHELAVLAGAERTLAAREVDAVIMETNESGRRFGVSDDTLLARMIGFGFEACVYDPFARTLAPRTAGSANTIFVRDRAAIEARCRAARRTPLLNGSI